MTVKVLVTVGVGGLVLVRVGLEVFVLVGARESVAVPVGTGSAVAVTGSVAFRKTADVVSAGGAGVQEQRKSNASTKFFT